MEFFKDFFDRQQPNNNGKQAPRKATSLGSGFVIDASGIIVTNNHVIAGADEVRVVLHDGRITGTLDRSVATEEAVMELATGGGSGLGEQSGATAS